MNPTYKRVIGSEAERMRDRKECNIRDEERAPLL